MSFLASTFDKMTDSNSFEKLCVEVMQREGYLGITLVAGSNDKGRDAEDKLYSTASGQRVVYFQFSLEKTIRRKVLQTLERIREARHLPNQIVFLFSSPVSPTQRDNMVDKALAEYAMNIEIKDQVFLVSRLAQKPYRDIAARCFAREISEFKSLYEEDSFMDNTGLVDEAEERILANLMLYGNHPFSGEFRDELLKQTVMRVLSQTREPLDRPTIRQQALDRLPPSLNVTASNIDSAVDALALSKDVVASNFRYELAPDASAQVSMGIASLAAGRKAIFDSIILRVKSLLTNSVTEQNVRKVTGEFFTQLFRHYGNEVANAVLDNNSESVTTALNTDQLDHLFAQVVPDWAPALRDVFKCAIRELLVDNRPHVIEFFNALSRSYILMQLLRLDPEGINTLYDRLADSVVVLDTDVVLSALVDGSDRHMASNAILDKCVQLGLQFFVCGHAVDEIVRRIERSIAFYEDLGRPSMIPPDKSDLFSDLFLDVYFDDLAAGKVTSFDQFIQKYYNSAAPHEYIKHLITDVLGIPIERVEAFQLLPQEDKLDRLYKTIESNRRQSGSYKHPELYQADALQMLVVEQQNRNKLQQGRLGRWYLVSSDRHILKAYLENRNSFKVKPCVLPSFFLERMRLAPTNRAESDSFHAILQSETMLRGVGQNHTVVIAALSRLGIHALTLPRARLLELIEDMDRADFTQWLCALRHGNKLSRAAYDEMGDTLRRLVAESKSREDEISRLQQILKQYAKS